MLCRLEAIVKNQKGFTLIEVLIALTITGLITGAITMSVSQVVTNNARSNAHMMSAKQVESAIHWISRDVQMAQIVEPDGGSGFPLNLTWVEWDNTVNQVTYTLENGVLSRSHSVNGGAPKVTAVARHIDTDAGETNCQFAGGVLTLKITAAVDGFRPASETRVCDIVSRPAA